jgi:hypothetical protein
MSADVIIAFANAATQAVLAVLGISLSPKRSVQIIIGAIALIGIVLTVVQAKRSHDDQYHLRLALDQINQRVTTIKSDNERPITVNVQLPNQPNKEQGVSTQQKIEKTCSVINFPTLSDPRLKKCVLDFVLDLRRLLEDFRNKSSQIENERESKLHGLITLEVEADHGKYDRAAASKITDDYNQYYLSVFNDLIFTYASRYKVDAVIYRDELRRRVPVGKRYPPSNTPIDAFYDNATNTFGVEDVTSDLERLAKLLPD